MSKVALLFTILLLAGSASANLLVDGDMEAAGTGAWTALNAILTKDTASPHSGLQYLQINYSGNAQQYAYQAVLTPGYRYHLYGYAGGDGTARPFIMNGATTLWTGATDKAWQVFDFVFIAGADTAIYFGSNDGAAGAYVNFDDIVLDAAPCVNLSNNGTWGNNIANSSGVLYINRNTTLCTDTYSINTTSAGTVLNVNSSNIYLDCNNSILNGVTGNGYGIYMTGKENVTIRNCVTTLYIYGFNLASSSRNINITNNFMHNNTQRGIYINGDANARANNFTFTNNNIWNGTQYGAYIEYLENSTFRNNTAYLNTYYGFYLESTKYNLFTGNNVSNQTSAANGDGFYITDSDSNNFTYNIFSGNGRRAFHLQFGNDYNIFDGNNMSSGGGALYYGQGGNYNNVTNNIMNCTPTACSSNMLYTSTTGTLLTNNYAFNSTTVCFQLGGTAHSFINNTGDYCTGGISSSATYSWIANNTIRNSTTTGFSISSSGNYANITGNLAIDAKSQSGTPQTCFYISGTGVNLSSNVAYNCTDDCFILSNAGVSDNLSCTIAGEYGYYLAADYIEIRNSIASRVTQYGFYLPSSGGYDHNNLTNVVANRCAYGFEFENHNYTIVNATASNSTTYGFYLGSALDLSIINSTAYSSGSYNLYASNAKISGISIHLYNGTTADAYIGGSTSGRGVYFSNLTIDSFAGNYSNYTSISIYQTFTGSSIAYTIKWNGQPAALPAGVSQSFAQKYINITTSTGAPSINQTNFTWLDSETTGYKEKNFWLYKYNASGWTLQSGAPDTTNNVLSISDFRPGSTYGILQGIPDCVDLADDSTWGTKIVNVSSVLYVNQNTTLCRDTYSINAGSGTAVLQINSSNIYLDCNQSILNGADGDGYGIYLPTKENVTVRNCQATLYSYGLHVAGLCNNINITNNFMYNSSNREISIDGDANARANNFTFTNNNAWDGTQYGFYMEYVENASFSNNTAYINAIYGFYGEIMQYSNLTNNNISGSTGAFGTGLYLSASDSNSVVGNYFFTNARYGMELFGGSDYNLVESNTIYATADIGGFNEAGTGNNLTGNNVIWTNGDAYSLAGTGSVLRNNIASRSGSRSFVLTGTGLIAINNTGANTAGVGAYILANNVQFINNTIINASSSGGITTSSNTGLLISGNTVDRDSGGLCYQIQASSSTISDNVAFNCSTHGVYFYGSTNNVTNFTISYCTNYGFYMDAAITNNQITNSTITNCASGFYINSANFNNLSNNTAYNNTNYGFYFNGANSKNNSLSNSTSYENANGFYFDNTAYDNRIMDCAAYNNSQYGVYITGAATANGTNIHSYRNTLGDFYYSIDTGSATIKTYMGNLTIDNAAGDFQNYTSVSFVQSGIGTFTYAMRWDSNSTALPASVNASFAQKYVNITAVSGSPSIDAINFTWLESELPGYDENKFQLWKYNASGWANAGATLDTSANALSLSSFSPGSIYGILERSDTLPPNVTFEPPTPNSSTFSSIQTIEVNVSAEDASGVANITIYLYNSSALFNYSNGTSGELLAAFSALPDGIYHFNATAYDTVGNYNSTETRNVTIDTLLPNVGIEFPENGTAYNISSIDLNYTASDLYLDSCWYSLNGGADVPLPLCANATLSPGDGHYNLTLSANDSAGNANSTNVSFIVDTVAPSVAIQVPANSTYNYTGLDFNYTAFDSNRDSCWYSLNGGADVPLAGCTNTTFTATEGQNSIFLYANDTAGNLNSTNVYFTVDTIAPSVAIQSPANTTYNYTSLDLNYTASDIHLDSCWYSLNGGADVPLAGCTNTTFTAIEGQNSVFLYANDTAGNLNSTNVYFTVDTTAPSIAIQVPANATYNYTSLDFNYTASDIHLDSCWYVLNGGADVPLAGCTNATFTAIEGQNSLLLYANDTAGNLNSTSVYFTIDTIAPSVAIQSPANATYNYTSLDFNYTAADLHRDSCWYSLNGGADVPLPGCTNTTLTAIEGQNSLFLYANDTAGNLNSTNVYFTVDTTAPSLAVQVPANTTYNYTSLDLNYTASDIHLDSCWYSLNGGADVPLAGCANTTFTATEGQNSIFLYANDTAGNLNSTNVYFTVDTIAPSVAIQSPANTTYNYTSLDLNYTASDIHLDSCWYVLNGGANVPLAGCANTTFTAAEGQNSLFLYANDTAGNTNSTNVSFTADSTPPSLAIQSPVAGTFYHHAPVGLNYTASDTHLDSCWYELDGGSAVPLPGCLNSTLSPPNGGHSLELSANDTSGNLNSTSVSFTMQVPSSAPPAPSDEGMEVEWERVCPGNIITITASDGGPLEDADVRLILREPNAGQIGGGTTGPDGSVSFNASMNGTYNAFIELAGYAYDNPLVFPYTTCVPEEAPEIPECNVSADCAAGETCSGGACIIGEQPAEQPAGEEPPEGGQAGQSTGGRPQGTEAPSAPQCIVDTDCASGFGCQNGSCATVSSSDQPAAQGEETPAGTPSTQPTQPGVPSWAWLLILIILGAVAYWHFRLRKKA